MHDDTLAPLRATSAQYGIWVAQQVDPGSPSYLTAEAIEFNGALDVPLLLQCAAEVLGHAQALHMRFAWEGDALWQYPQPPQLAPAGLALLDFSAEADGRQAAADWMRRSLATACDVTRQPLYQSALLRTAADTHLWFLQVHHIALDGFGYSLVQQAVARRYNARRQGLQPPPLPDWRLDRVVQAEADYRSNGGFDRDRGFWLQHLARVPAAAHLALAQEPCSRPLRHAVRLDAAQVQALQSAARASGADWAAWMLAAIGLWLGRHSGQRDLCFGIPVMNRMGTPALGVPCMAMNIVPFSVHLRPGQTLRQLAGAAVDQLRAIKPHLYYRYGWIRGDHGLLQDGRFFFNQAVNLMPFDRHVAFNGVRSRMVPLSGGPVKDLNLTLVVDQGDWVLTLEANPQAYDEARLRALAGDLATLLQALAQSPADASLAASMAPMPVPSTLQGPAVALPEAGVLQWIHEAAASAPDAVAVEWAGGQLSYRRLLARAGRLAAQLARRGVRTGDTVAMLLPRSADAIVGALAVLWAGGVYAPFDPAGPATRTRGLLGSARPRLVLTQAPWHELAADWPTLRLDLPDVADASPPPCHTPLPNDPAYLLFTSGSTGQPKGVRVGHGGLAQFVASTRGLYGIGPDDRVLQFAPLHFDASLEETFATLCHGATLVLRDDAMVDSAEAFAAAVQRLRLTVLDLPTAYWHALAHALDEHSARRLQGVRLVVIGGEAALPERAARWAALLPQVTLLNTYGPTEATIIATAAALAGPQAAWRPGEPVPIGLPRPGTQVRVADERGYPVPEGRTGELLICGPGLALDYLHDAALTTARFVTLPDTGERAYRSGDLAVWQGGQLRFLGRIDGELKISGLRVDPLEVENALLAVAGVQEAAVLPVRRAGDLCALEAFVVGEADGPALRAALQQTLPAPAVPEAWHRVAQLPRNANGKIDRRALEAMRPAAEPVAAGDARPVAAEQAVMQAWQEVLGQVALTPSSNFFELGGKSLQAIQVASRLSHALQRDVGVSMLFRHATVQSLARALDAPAPYRAPVQQDPFAPVLPIQQAGPDAPVLLCLYPAEGLAWGYLRLARHLPGVTLVGLQLVPGQAAAAGDFDGLVQALQARVKAVQPQGPYRLLGWSLGGALAQALAVQLAAQGDEVALLALMDSYPAEAWQQHPPPRSSRPCGPCSPCTATSTPPAWRPRRCVSACCRRATPSRSWGTKACGAGPMNCCCSCSCSVRPRRRAIKAPPSSTRRRTTRRTSRGPPVGKGCCRPRWRCRPSPAGTKPCPMQARWPTSVPTWLDASEAGHERHGARPLSAWRGRGLRCGPGHRRCRGAGPGAGRR